MTSRLLIFCFFLATASLRGQIITTFAGTDSAGYSGDGGPAALAKFNQPAALAIDASGNIYVADAGNNVVRKISASGVITTVAGNGYGAGSGSTYNNTTMVGGYSGNGGPATQAQLFCPFDVAVDNSGNLFIADAFNHVIRKVNTVGIITTVAGNHTLGYSGNYGPATSARLNYPKGIAVDSAGNLYISDYGNSMVREVIASSGIIKKIAGGGSQYPGNGGPATSAVCSGPQGIEINQGIIYFADMPNDRIRKITPDGKIWTVAGISGPGIPNGYSGNGGPAIAATLNEPNDMTIDAQGNIYVGDTWNYEVRKIDTSGIIDRWAGMHVAGTSTSNGDGGPALLAHIGPIASVALDRSCNLYLIDGNKIRKVSFGDNFSDSVITSNLVCGDTLGSALIVPPASGHSPYTYNIGSGNQSSNLFTGLYSGVYSYTITNSIGCTYSPAKTFTVTQINPAIASFFPSPDTTCAFEPVIFNDSSRANSYLWNINGSTFIDKEPYYYFTAPGQYNIKLTVTLDPGNCIDSVQHSISIMDCPPDSTGIVAPNIFTPNGDGINDLWQPVLYNYHFTMSSYHCVLFDRWGVKLFETDDPRAGWAGKTLNGLNCSDGTYFYVIHVSGSNFLNVKKTKAYRGFLELTR